MNYQRCENNLDKILLCLLKLKFLLSDYAFAISVALNMISIVSIKQVPWTEGKSWLVVVFDWDEIIVDGSTPAQLSFGLDLCTKSCPCKAQIMGKNAGVISRLDNGFISCIASNGCTGLVLQSVQIICPDSDMNTTGAVLQSYGSNVTIITSAFSACTSMDGVIQAYGGATAEIRSTKFVNMYNSVLKIQQSNLIVLNSSFSNPDNPDLQTQFGRRTSHPHAEVTKLLCPHHEGA
jgi:hypothetical protein